MADVLDSPPPWIMMESILPFHVEWSLSTRNTQGEPHRCRL
jgi:hypothetical protein